MALTRVNYSRQGNFPIDKLPSITNDKLAGSITHVVFSPQGVSSQALCVNLTNGSVHNAAGSLVAHSVVNQLGGWYRISISWVSTVTSLTNM